MSTFGKKHKKKKSINFFNYKGIWVWIFFASILVLGAVCFGSKLLQRCFCCFIECLGKDKNTILNFMRDQEDFLGTVVWTMATIMATFVSFYYSLSSAKNFGIPNRKVISLSFGSGYILSIVFVNGCAAVLMTFYYYFQYDTLFYIFAAFSCYLQAFLIIICVYSTSQRKCKKFIVKTMKELYGDMCEKVADLSEDDIFTDNKVCNSIDYYIDSIIMSKESIDDKAVIIDEILDNVTKMQSTELNQNTFVEKRTGHIWYYYVIKNIVQYLVQNPDKANPIYNIFYDYLDREKGSDLKEEHLLAFFGAVFLNFIPAKELDERWMFLSNLIKQSKIEKKAIIVWELLLSMVYLESIKSFECISGSKQYDLIKECLESLNVVYENMEEQEVKGRLESYVGIWLTNTLSLSDSKSRINVRGLLNTVDNGTLASRVYLWKQGGGD